MASISSSFYKNVFINCPFDDLYTDIINAIIFAVHDIGFRPRCALETSNAGQVRIEKIFEIISECKYSIHDLSRTQLDPKSKLPRFNMPLELGIDLGCKKFGKLHHSEKVILILDKEPYRYQEFVSDISGQDIKAHDNDFKFAINIVRDWLRNELDANVFIIPSGDEICQRYEQFKNTLPLLCKKLHWNAKALPYIDFSYVVATWISNHPFVS
jgi:hypothetical protein